MTRAEAMADLDAQICRDAEALAQQALDAGWRADELPTLLRPWLQQVAVVRARAVARLDRMQCTLH